MKPKRVKHSKPVSRPVLPSGSDSPSLMGIGPANTRRRWWFRAVAMMSPLALLVLLELGLRVGGYGYPTSFFLPVRVDGQDMLRENPRFGWRFFPPSAARTPRPLWFAAKKPPGTVRIIVLGESAAMGDPEPTYGFPRQLERLLQARHPGERVEVINAAMTAINSHVMREIARDCARAQADFWLIYAGNNEVVGPFGAGTVFGRQAPGLGVVRLTLALRATRIGQFIAGLAAHSSEPAQWEGMEMFLGQQVNRDDPRLKNVYANFAANLADVAALGRSAGATVLLATVPVNLKDSPPFGSSHRAGLSPADLRAWETNFTAGRWAETNGAFADAVAAYQRAAKLDADHAELVFCRGQAELKLGQTPAADADFKLARDLDTLRFRADSRLNEIVRQTAQVKGVPLVDAELECARRFPNGLPGDELFYDHVHPNFSGNFLVADLFSSPIEQAWPINRSSAKTREDKESEIARRLAFTDFDQRRVLEEMRARLQQPPFSSQTNFRERDQLLGQRLASLQTEPRELIPSYRDALGLAPNDAMLHANFARLLEAAGDGPAASAQWQEVTRLLPYWPNAWLSLGHLADEAGQNSEAEGFFLHALRLQPDSVEALNELGVLALAQGRITDAQARFKQALRLRPGYSPARVNLALALAKKGDGKGATLQYQEVLRRDTNNVDARVNLGVLLAGEGRVDQSIALYEEALRLRPDYSPAHFNLAKALVAKGRHAEAVLHYQAVVQRKPDFAQAQLELGIELAQLGNGPGALERFAEAARLKPDWADARFNYGVALAKARRYAEAVEEFQATLKLQPEHPFAARALERAMRSASPK